MKILFSLFSAAALTLSADPFADKLMDDVRSCIQNSGKIAPKEEILSCLDAIAAKGSILETGGDDLRIKFVHLQGCIEHALACAQALGEIEFLAGAIHTPMPATPLCALPDEDPSDLLDASIRGDAQKLSTVRSRAQIVREYLAKGGTLFIAYPKQGYEKRNAQQQAIYQSTLRQFPTNLIDSPLPTDIPPDLIGATYLFRSQGKLYAFAIQARQANDIQSQSQWGIWFGPADHPDIARRIEAVSEFLSQSSRIDLRASP